MTEVNEVDVVEIFHIMKHAAKKKGFKLLPWKMPAGVKFGLFKKKALFPTFTASKLADIEEYLLELKD